MTVELLVNEEATKDEILGGFDWPDRETTGRDVAMIFLSGHGINGQAVFAGRRELGQRRIHQGFDRGL